MAPLRRQVHGYARGLLGQGRRPAGGSHPSDQDQARGSTADIVRLEPRGSEADGAPALPHVLPGGAGTMLAGSATLIAGAIEGVKVKVERFEVGGLLPCEAGRCREVQSGFCSGQEQKKHPVHRLSTAGALIEHCFEYRSYHFEGLPPALLDHIGVANTVPLTRRWPPTVISKPRQHYPIVFLSANGFYLPASPTSTGVIDPSLIIYIRQTAS